MIPVTSFAGKTVAVFGLGGSGLASCHALKAGGAEVVASDDSLAKLAEAAKAGFITADLRGVSWANFSALVLTPGVPFTHPEPHWTVLAAKAAGVECTTHHVAADDPWRGILQVAKKQKCDLIVMASHGLRGMSAALLGSETQKVLTHGEIPVLVCR